MDYKISEILHNNRLIERGIIQFGTHLYSHDYSLFIETIELLGDINYSWWNEQKNWTLSGTFLNRYELQKKFILGNFVELLNKDAIVCDIAAGTGEFARLISPYVNSIDAFELSEKMVEFAIEKSISEKKFNINIKQKCATELQLLKEYDGIMLLGLLTCLENEVEVRKIIKKVYDSLKPKGLLVVKDSITLASDDVYMFNYADNYRAKYRTKENYINLYREVGFKFREVSVLDLVKEELGGASIAILFEK